MEYNEIESRLNALHQLLRNTDYKAVKYAEGYYSNEEYEPIRLQREAWREEIRELEYQRATEAAKEGQMGYADALIAKGKLSTSEEKALTKLVQPIL